MPTRPPPRRAWKWLRRLMCGVVLGVGLVLLLLLIWLRGALYNHFVRYPREAAAWQALRAQQVAVPDETGWREFRGILHSHSHLSHDCEVPFEEILRVMQ